MSNFEATFYSLCTESKRLSPFLQLIYREERQTEEKHTTLEPTIVKDNSDTTPSYKQTKNI